VAMVACHALPVTLTLTLLISLALAGPLAAASPTDPLWIPGIYDDADGDDIVGLSTGTAAAVRRPLAPDPFFSSVRSIRAADLPPFALPCILGVHLRSPPIP
jgi:hypothetical protein